jgi:hypothetical protein
MLTSLNNKLSGVPEAELTIEELISFQDADGSFKLVDSYAIESDARIDFCYVPTYLGAAILMREILTGNRKAEDPLRRALNASLSRSLGGHGYEAEDGRIKAMNIFIKGGLKDFLKRERQLCPEFHCLIHNIIYEYKLNLFRGKNCGAWGEDYAYDWRNIIDTLKSSQRYYIAYGSNMNKKQMRDRCPGATGIGKTYVKNYQLTLPNYANIEPCVGMSVPAFLWEITSADEDNLDACEGYPHNYVKIEIITEFEGNCFSAMAYVMTKKGKERRISLRAGYYEDILQGYVDAGFDISEYKLPI